MEWNEGNENSTDLGTKNLDAASNRRHMKVLCGDINTFFHPILK